MNTFTLTPKNIPNLNTFDALIRLSVPEFDGFNIEDDVISVVLTCEVTPELQSQVESIVPPTLTLEAVVRNTISEAMSFGSQVILEFATSNVMLGITQDQMTGTVRRVTSEVISCLTTGSLYDAINELKAIPSESYDSKYITEARLLECCNKIEDYLGISLSESL